MDPIPPHCTSFVLPSCAPEEGLFPLPGPAPCEASGARSEAVWKAATGGLLACGSVEMGGIDEYHNASINCGITASCDFAQSKV